ncbi:unnamed protein product [Ixodes persulcatus]
MHSCLIHVKAAYVTLPMAQSLAVHPSAPLYLLLNSFHPLILQWNCYRCSLDQSYVDLSPRDDASAHNHVLQLSIMQKNRGINTLCYRITLLIPCPAAVRKNWVSLSTRSIEATLTH